MRARPRYASWRSRTLAREGVPRRGPRARYLVGALPEGARAHVGTTDVDLVIGLALGDETPETYRTLETNLKNSGFTQGDSSFQWKREVDGTRIDVEFLCETDQVEPGRIFRPKGEATGSSLGAFNVRGAQLLTSDYVEREIEAERLDGGGRSTITVRVANLLPYVVLKILSFQDRHENKDAYDLVFCILHFGEGPDHAGTQSAASPVAGHAQVDEALALLAERFETVDYDGPAVYGLFLADPGNDEEMARLRQEAVATVHQFLGGFGR